MKNLTPDYKGDESEPMSGPILSELYSRELARWLIILILVATSGSLFLSAIFSNPTLRKQPYRWLQSLAAAASVAYAVGLFTVDIPKSLNFTTVCVVIILLPFLLFWIVHFATLAVSVDRVVSLINGSPHTGFSTKQAAIAIIAAVGIPLILLLVFITVFEAPGVINHNCFISGSFYVATKFVVICIAALLGISTLILAMAISKIRCCDKDHFPLGKILPIIIGNIVVAMGLLFTVYSESLGLSNMNIDTLVLSAMLLLWILGDGDVREAVFSMFCLCCPSNENEDKTVLMDPVNLEQSVTIWLT